MLVYLKEPMGLTQVEGYRVAGKYYNYGRLGPTNIPRDIWRRNKGLLEEMEYTGELLSEIFGSKFPSVRFKISEFWKLEFNSLVEVAKLMGIKYKRPRNPSLLERKALRRSVLKILDIVR